MVYFRIEMGLGKDPKENKRSVTTAKRLNGMSFAKAEAELKHLEGFLNGVMKKLSNERFVNNAPAQVVELERKKQADAESKIATLKETIASLKK